MLSEAGGIGTKGAFKYYIIRLGAGGQNQNDDNNDDFEGGGLNDA